MFTQQCDSVTVVHGDQMAVGVDEGEHPAEGAVDGWNRDRHAVGEQLVVQFLGVGGVQPQATKSGPVTVMSDAFHVNVLT